MSDDTETVMVRPVATYTEEDGSLKRRGGPAYAVPRRHAADLAMNGLVEIERDDTGAKAAPASATAEAPAPENRSAPAARTK